MTLLRVGEVVNLILEPEVDINGVLRAKFRFCKILEIDEEYVTIQWINPQGELSQKESINKRCIRRIEEEKNDMKRRSGNNEFRS